MEPAERLALLDTCAVSDACDRLGLDGQVVIGIANRTGVTPVAGRVVTVELGAPVEAGSTRHLCADAIEFASTGDVIVVAHQGRTDCAGWGGNLSRAAAFRGIEGTLVDGAARDIDEARELLYPVYAVAATPRTARGRAQQHSWNEPINFAGVTVAPGDWVIADATGIVFVPADAIDRILVEAEAIAATEATMARSIDAGAAVSEIMGGAYETMLDNDDVE